MKSVPTFALSLALALTVTGCSTNMVNKGAGGAAAGALSASFIGAATDLILDGKVNTDRLARNAVGGAIGGGMAGTAVGYQQDVKAEQQVAQKAAQTTAEAKGVELQKTIGKSNYSALVALLNKQHSDAYRYTLESTSSKKSDVKAAAYGIQALIDMDRGNADGVTEALTSFIGLEDQTDDLPTARKDLDLLYKELQQERKIQGIR